MRQKEVVNSVDFLKLLVGNKGILTDLPLTVNSDFLTIDGEKMELESMHLECVTFTGMLTIYGFKKMKSLTISSSYFLGGLAFESNAGGHISIQSIETKWLHMWGCCFNSVFFNNVEVDGSLDISGLELSEKLIIGEADFSQLELIHQHTSYTTKTPWVKTDNQIVARQFRLIGVPVFMSTEAVRKMIESEVEGRFATV